MKFELPALQSEPLIYFLLHSGLFVLILGVLFFALGLWFGGLTWGKYKRQSITAREENQALLGEIAVLKRKLAEQSLRPTTATTASPALLTEVLPTVREIFPERQTLYPILASLPPPPAAVPVKPEAEMPTLQASPEAPVDRSASVLPDLEPAEKPKISAPSPKSQIRAKTKPATSEQPLPTIPEPTIEVEPFGFLLSEPAVPAPTSTREGPTALDSIIKGKPASKSPRGAAKTGKTTKVKLPPTPPPITNPEPEIDPALGPVYREAPSNADDLTKIKGIAGVLAKRLNDLGVHTFQQIASWEDRHVREFSTRLAFKDRIMREAWVDQARRLEKDRQSV
jgi:predicted flap endonuclease-1-like 5' DNA nuclease